jgi:hypothetical protein
VKDEQGIGASIPAARQFQGPPAQGQAAGAVGWDGGRIRGDWCGGLGNFGFHKSPEKSEIRRPKVERNPKAEIRIAAADVGNRSSGISVFGLRIAAFFRPSAFGFRILLEMDFGILRFIDFVVV